MRARRGTGENIHLTTIFAKKISMLTSLRCRAAYDEKAKRLRLVYQEIGSLWDEFLESCEERWTLQCLPEAPSVSGAQRLRHASDDSVAKRASEKLERKERPPSAPKKLSAVQIANSSLALAKGATRNLKAPWYSRHWHLFAPFLPEDLRPRNSRLGMQLIGQQAEPSSVVGRSGGGDGGALDHSGSASDQALSVRQPRSIVNGKMFPYQIEGLEWMVRQHSVGVGGILGDEMGLGKTLQVL